MRKLILATMMASLAWGLAAAQATPSSGPAPTVHRGRLVGVFDGDTGEPLAGVEIRNLLNGLSALTSATGTLTLSFVDSTGGMLSIRKVGYDPQVVTVPNSPHDTTGVTIVLKRVAQLPAVVTHATAVDSTPRYISPNLRAFEERRRQGFGHFISEAELRKREGSRLSEVITALVPGVERFPGRGGIVNLASHRAGGSAGRALNPGRCFVTIYLDGVLYYTMTTPGSTPPDFTTFQAETYAGIEFYAGGASLPVQYTKTDAGCGTLLLWTRER